MNICTHMAGKELALTSKCQIFLTASSNFVVFLCICLSKLLLVEKHLCLVFHPVVDGVGVGLDQALRHHLGPKLVAQQLVRN